MLHFSTNAEEVWASVQQHVEKVFRESAESAAREYYQSATRQRHTTARPAANGGGPPPMVAVVSSDLHSVGYDGVARRLYIRFHSRLRPYVYLAVPVEVYGELMGAHSKGSYFHANIKPRFQCIK